MEEQINFINNLGTDHRKPVLAVKAEILQNRDTTWIFGLQHQLSQSLWNGLSITQQMTMLYVLNVYFREEHKKGSDLSSWIPCIDHVLTAFNINEKHEKEVRHILKMITGWLNKDPQSLKRIFPKELTQNWMSSIRLRAINCGINLSEQSTKATNEQCKDDTSIKPLSHSNIVQSFLPSAVLPSQGAGKRPREDDDSSDVIRRMNADYLHAMCLFQMQIFRSFLSNATRRLDRWNMRIVMNASYYLLHLYVDEFGVADVQAAALVVSCIYLAGKAEYLFVKADKLRPIANKFVQSSLNEPFLSNNIQIYKYEAQLLRLLQYNVGNIPNPLRCLKALDILEANRIGNTNVGSPILSLSSSNLNLHNNLKAISNSDASAPTQPPSSPRASSTAAELVTPARQLLDQAAEVLADENALFSGKFLSRYDDYYLASAVYLEKAQACMTHNDGECSRSMEKILSDLALMPGYIRHARTPVTVDPIRHSYSIIDSMEQLRADSMARAALIMPNSTNTTADSTVADMDATISDRTVRLAKQVIPQFALREQQRQDEASKQELLSRQQREAQWNKDKPQLKGGDVNSDTRARTGSRSSMLNGLVEVARSASKAHQHSNIQHQQYNNNYQQQQQQQQQRYNERDSNRRGDYSRTSASQQQQMVKGKYCVAVSEEEHRGRAVQKSPDRGRRGSDLSRSRSHSRSRSRSRSHSSRSRSHSRSRSGSNRRRYRSDSRDRAGYRNWETEYGGKRDYSRNNRGRSGSRDRNYNKSYKQQQSWKNDRRRDRSRDRGYNYSTGRDRRDYYDRDRHLSRSRSHSRSSRNDSQHGRSNGDQQQQQKHADYRDEDRRKNYYDARDSNQPRCDDQSDNSRHTNNHNYNHSFSLDPFPPATLHPHSSPPRHRGSSNGIVDINNTDEFTPVAAAVVKAATSTSDAVPAVPGASTIIALHTTAASIAEATVDKTPTPARVVQANVSEKANNLVKEEGEISTSEGNRSAATQPTVVDFQSTPAPAPAPAPVAISGEVRTAQDRESGRREAQSSLPEKSAIQEVPLQVPILASPQPKPMDNTEAGVDPRAGVSVNPPTEDVPGTTKGAQNEIIRSKKTKAKAMSDSDILDSITPVGSEYVPALIVVSDHNDYTAIMAADLPHTAASTATATTGAPVTDTSATVTAAVPSLTSDLPIHAIVSSNSMQATTPLEFPSSIQSPRPVSTERATKSEKSSCISNPSLPIEKPSIVRRHSGDLYFSEDAIIDPSAAESRKIELRAKRFGGGSVSVRNNNKSPVVSSDRLKGKVEVTPSIEEVAAPTSLTPHINTSTALSSQSYSFDGTDFNHMKSKSSTTSGTATATAAAVNRVDKEVKNPRTSIRGGSTSINATTLQGANSQKKNEKYGRNGGSNNNNNNKRGREEGEDVGRVVEEVKAVPAGNKKQKVSSPRAAPRQNIKNPTADIVLSGRLTDTRVCEKQKHQGTKTAQTANEKGLAPVARVDSRPLTRNTSGGSGGGCGGGGAFSLINRALRGLVSQSTSNNQKKQ